ncbi:tetratricopeptide repeat protein [Pseudazoarcus pumilus]|uniref:protein O-GlcNAc transferase n=1 Tax=Pseudazoarcus pumilus TaxID=2067960 RepID=A0A2I6S914_9RHOO|nr:tetratricopeptide repeat protein [Pseudazoarcus pumilus]AUN95742.1 hypothetical protein C0099_12850 [Pseudazoarcus pumilus]
MKGVQELVRQGKLVEADALAKRYQDTYPDRPEVYFGRGIVQRLLKNWPNAVKLFDRAAVLKPDSEQYRVSLVNVLIESAHFGEAERLARSALERFPQSEGLRTALGLGLMYSGMNEEAEKVFRDLLDRKPDDPGVLMYLADCMHRMGRFASVEPAMREAIEKYPRSIELNRRFVMMLGEEGRVDEAIDHLAAVRGALPEAQYWVLMGEVLEAGAREGFALDCFNNALVQDSGLLPALNGKTRALVASGFHDKAAACAKSALKRDPLSSDAHIATALVLQTKKRISPALEHAWRAVSLDPCSRDGHLILGLLLVESGDHANALKALHRAVKLGPRNATVHASLGQALYGAKSREKARVALEEALRLAPQRFHVKIDLLSVSRDLCDWDRVECLEKELIDAAPDEYVSPLLACAMKSVSRRYLLEAGQSVGKAIEKARIGDGRAVFDHGDRQGKGRPERLKLAYLSSDFRQHAVSLLAVELFESHDRGRFELFAYSAAPDDGSDLGRRVLSAFDHVRDVSGLDDAALARSVVEDGIDIIVDLNGHTKGARLGALAQRPAPVQVTYLGYPATTGLDYIDYIVIDEVLAPEHEAEDYSEKFAYVEASYQCNDSHRKIGKRPDRESCGLPKKGFVFCCFNQHYKITREVFAAWCDIVASSPGSVLWLAAGDEGARKALKARFVESGLQEDRLVFASVVPYSEHLARLQNADLALDTAPYNMHTTASDILYAGVPILTIEGQTFASRVGASLMTAIGIPELVASDLAEYKARAVDISKSRKEAAALKARLQDGVTGCRLFDGNAFARQVENLFDQMWCRFDRGQSPAVLRVGDGPSGSSVGEKD